MIYEPPKRKIKPGRIPVLRARKEQGVFVGHYVGTKAAPADECRCQQWIRDAQKLGVGYSIRCGYCGKESSHGFFEMA